MKVQVSNLLRRIIGENNACESRISETDLNQAFLVYYNPRSKRMCYTFNQLNLLTPICAASLPEWWSKNIIRSRYSPLSEEHIQCDDRCCVNMRYSGILAPNGSIMFNLVFGYKTPGTGRIHLWSPDFPWLPISLILESRVT